MEEIEIPITAGKVKLIKPKAGARNKAALKAETPEGIKETAFMIEILPYCVAEHPFGTQKLSDALDNLSIEEYDKLIEGLTQLMNVGKDVKKKSEE